MDDARFLQSFADKVVARSGIPGIGIAVSARGRLLEAASGVRDIESGLPLDTQSGFELGCLSKLLTAGRILILASRGLVHLDRPVSAYLPEVRGTRVDVSLRSLLSHTGGYQPEDLADAAVKYDYSWERFLEIHAGTSTQFPPGRTFNYVHSGYALLGRVADLVEGATTRAGSGAPASDGTLAVRGHVVDGLDGGYRVVEEPRFSDFWRHSLLGGAWRLGDIVKRCEDLLAGQAGGLLTPVVTLPPRLGGPRSEYGPDAFCLGLGRYADGVYGLKSSFLGQACALYVLDDPRVVLAVGLNSNQVAVRDFAAARLVELFTGRELAPPHGRALSLVGTPAEYSGTYVGALGATLRVDSFGSHLTITPGDANHQRNVFNAAIELKVDDDNRLTLLTDMRHWSISLFKEPSDETPCIMLGLTTFRKLPAATIPDRSKDTRTARRFSAQRTERIG